VLKQCSNDFSRENLMEQATNLRDLENPAPLPGIKLNISLTKNHPIRQLRLMRWTGETWELFGDIIADASARSHDAFGPLCRHRSRVGGPSDRIFQMEDAGGVLVE
jgi:hypothetical protein